MSKRQRKKRNKYIIDNIQKINLQEDDILVFKFNNKMTHEALKRYAEYIKQNVSNKIIFILKNTELVKVTDKRNDNKKGESY